MNVMIKTPITALKAIEKVKRAQDLIWKSILEHFENGSPKVGKEGVKYFDVDVDEDICIRSGECEFDVIIMVQLNQKKKNAEIKLAVSLEHGSTVFLDRATAPTIDLAYILQAIESTYGNK